MSNSEGKQCPMYGTAPLLAGLLAFLAGCLGSLFAQAQTDAQSKAIEEAARQSQFTIVDDPAGLARVQEIVNRMFRVADTKDVMVAPPIRIVTADQPPNAKADGTNLFVTESLLKLLHDDNELAIVVGHELAHHILGHSKGTSFEYRISSTARKLGFRGDLPTIMDATTQVLEAQADQYGILYAALAGYDVSSAADVYDKVLVSDDDPTHPPKAERQQKFRERLQNILDAVDGFNVGVDYTLRGQLTSAEMVFQELLQNDFRTHDIYHNLATVHHQLAFRKHLLPKDSPATVCSLTLELTSVLEPQGTRRQVATRGADSPPDSDRRQFVAELGQAIELYQQALRAKPEAVVSMSNLGCAYLHRGEEGDLEQAAGTLKRAAKLDPGNATVANNLAVAYWLGGSKQNAVAELQRSLQINPNFAPAHYNLAAVLEAAGTPHDIEASHRAFQQYLQDSGGVRSPYYLAHARERLGLKSVADSPSSNPPALSEKPRPRPDFPVAPGDPVSSVPAEAGTPRKVNISHEGNIQLWRFADWQVLVRDGQVDQVTMESARTQTPDGIRVGARIEEVRKTYGVPDAEEARGELAILCYPQRGLMFRVRSGTVYAWSAF